MATNGKSKTTAVATVTGGAMQVFDPSKFKAASANMMRVSASSGRSEFLRMDKSGDWYYGVNDIPVTEDDTLYVDPMGSVHGWQCWADTDLPEVKSAALLGNEVVPAHEPLPPRPAVVPKTGREWAGMAGLSLLLNGHKLTYTTNSLGGLDAVAAFSAQLDEQYEIDPSKMVAVVRLENDFYMHKKWGKTYTPVFDVVGFVAAPPSAEDAPAKPKAVKPKAAPAKGKAVPPPKGKTPLGRPAARR